MLMISISSQKKFIHKIFETKSHLNSAIIDNYSE